MDTIIIRVLSTIGIIFPIIYMKYLDSRNINVIRHEDGFNSIICLLFCVIALVTS